MHCFKLIFLVICLFTMASCKSEDPNPELLDPIYKFLVEQGNALKPAYESEKKKLEDAQTAYEKLDVNTAEKKQALKEIRQMAGKLARLEQELAYNEIRRERRRVEGRRDYRIAYQKGEVWPKPGEYEQFMTQHRLRIASRNWGARVPSLQARIDKVWPKPDLKSKDSAEEKPAEGSSGH